MDVHVGSAKFLELNQIDVEAGRHGANHRRELHGRRRHRVSGAHHSGGNGGGGGALTTGNAAMEGRQSALSGQCEEEPRRCPVNRPPVNRPMNPQPRLRMNGQVALADGFGSSVGRSACGGGSGGISGTPAPPPTSRPYCDGSLNGTYAFLMRGQDSGGFFARAGSFTANGAGSITGGVEDLNSGAVGTAILRLPGGTYSISSNGKGTLSLTIQPRRCNSRSL